MERSCSLLSGHRLLGGRHHQQCMPSPLRLPRPGRRLATPRAPVVPVRANAAPADGGPPAPVMGFQVESPDRRRARSAAAAALVRLAGSGVGGREAGCEGGRNRTLTWLAEVAPP